MTEPRNDDRSQARREAAALLNVDIDHMSPVDGLRVDMVSALRLVIDAEQASVLSGGSADLGKLNVAVQSLIALLPGRELPAESQHGDPRVKMFEIYMQMRERGELSLKALPEGGADARIAELTHENERLRARLAGGPAPAPLDVPTSDIVPPGEIGECYAGIRPGPDDPPPPLPIIEGVAMKRPNPPAAPAAPAAKRQPKWDSTPHAAAWRDWNAGGGGGAHYDRWKNRNE
jgi:hypothetical protein